MYIVTNIDGIEKTFETDEQLLAFAKTVYAEMEPHTKHNVQHEHIFNSITRTNGASWDVMNGKLNPSSGYMVAIKGYENKGEWDEHTPLSLFKNMLNNYLSKRVWDYIIDQHLQGKKLYIGMWVNEGSIYFDLSLHFKDRDKAIEAGKEAGQLAIWDCLSGKEIFI